MALKLTWLFSPFGGRILDVKRPLKFEPNGEPPTTNKHDIVAAKRLPIRKAGHQFPVGNQESTNG